MGLSIPGHRRPAHRADRDPPLEAAQLAWLRDAFADTQATRRPEAYHGGHRLPERLMGRSSPCAEPKTMNGTAFRTC